MARNPVASLGQTEVGIGREPERELALSRSRLDGLVDGQGRGDEVGPEALELRVRRLRRRGGDEEQESSD